jgi:hypothetical protein
MFLQQQGWWHTSSIPASALSLADPDLAAAAAAAAILLLLVIHPALAATITALRR